jgi:hypothetical protein
MKIAFYSLFSDQMRNRMFTNPNYASGAGDNLLLPMIRLKESAQNEGIECQTADMADIQSFDAFVFAEMPEPDNLYFQYAKRNNKPLFLIINENYFIWKPNAEYKRYGEFDVVFTYDDEAVNGQNIIKLNYAFDLPFLPDITINPRNKIAVMICSNSKRERKNLTYALRRDTIQWFEKWHPEDFDLYGFGWDRGTVPFQSYRLIHKTLHPTGILKILPRRKYPSWKGCVDRKRDVLCKYKFGFCYENTDKISGYITEKIFDVMMAGTVPIYLGAQNTSRHIPKKCFIDRADFKDHESLYSYISGMSPLEYRQYQEDIGNYLVSEQSSEFSIKTYVETLLSFFRRIPHS